MKTRFEPDDGPGAPESYLGTFTDSEPYDASEQRFAASLESRPMSGHTSTPEPDSHSLAEPAAEPALLPSDGAWRQEVAAKLNQYRARKRVRAPRYPSLQLRFETPDASWGERPIALPVAPTSRLAVAIQTVSAPLVAPGEASSVTVPVVTDLGAKIIEFPRFFPTPQLTFDELAEPVIDRPRILDVPEQMPPPPALGGMLIEPKEIPAAERRPGFELPLSPPPMSQRIAGAGIDVLFVAASFTVFAYIFFRITGVVPPVRQALAISAGLIAAFWAAYQYLFLVHSDTTPGLKLAKLQLSRFDGTTVPGSLRRWHVLASVLSLLSLGLGYAWCFLDEDQLCWHDRITRTYMASSRSRQPAPANSPEVH